MNNFTVAEQAVIRAAAERILVHPSSYDQATYFDPNAPDGNRQWLKALTEPECGAAGCLAYHLAAAARYDYRCYIQSPFNAAVDVLGWDYHELGDELLGTLEGIFGGGAGDWPWPYADAWYRASEDSDPAGLAKAAAGFLTAWADGRWYLEEDGVWLDEDGISQSR